MSTKLPPIRVEIAPKRTLMTIFLLVKFAFFFFATVDGVSQLDAEKPEDQRGCRWCPHAQNFYRVHEERRPDASNNWVCEESFENKIKICVSMLKTITGRKMNSTYELAEDENPVNRECVERPMTFYATEVNDTEEDLFDRTEITIGVWMFTCPISQVHLQFPRAQTKPPPAHITKNFYITKGKFDAKPIVAVLQDAKLTDNICLRDVWIFDYTKIISNRTQTWR